jgi:RNA polymerase sigma factor CnrH
MPIDEPSGRSAKIESLYNSLGRELWAMFYAYCCDRERAYDALQEAFVKLQEQNGTPIRDERAWLLHVGRNWLRDVARRKGNSARSAEHLDELAVSPKHVGEELEAQELNQQVRTALSTLRSDDREVLVLRYGLGWSSHRISEVLGVTSSAIDMRLSRARRRLGELLEQSGVGRE